MPVERLQKVLAQAGIASRRKAEQLISDGLVTVNGKVARLGDKAEWGKDAVKVDGKLLRQAETLVYLAFNKPKGVISMLADPQDRPTLANYLTKIKAKVFPIGRLDFNSEGLLLLTNDGAFAQKLQKAEELVRVYTVKVKGHPDSEMLARIARGTRQVGPTKGFKPYSICIRQSLPSKTILEVVLVGSGAFNLKSLFDTRGFLVEKIVRTAIGQITLKGLLPGEFRVLKASQAQALLTQPELGLKRVAEDAPRYIKPREKTAKEDLIRPVRPVVRPKTSERSGSKRIAPRFQVKPRKLERNTD